jgi:peptidoglycan hydrolase-like protein with peptidoglycan-binding domain/lysophospholipase L1-like esterase
MRFKEFKLIREATEGVYVSIGDSHAHAVAQMGGKAWLNLAVPGASSKGTHPRIQQMLGNISKIPKGSVVLVALGANDTANAMVAISAGKKPRNPSSIASDVASVIDRVKEQGPSKIIFLLFPNGPGRGPKGSGAEFYGGKYQDEVRAAIKSAVGVPIIDINGKPLTDGVHAGPSTYKEVAREVMGLAKPSQSATPVPTTADSKLDTDQGDKEAQPLTQLEVPMGRVGSEIADIQKVLVALGYALPKYGIDGIRGAETSGAVKAFQSDNKLTVDGDPGPETVGKLNDILKSKPELSKKLTKSTAADVKSRTPDRAIGSYTGDPGSGVGETGSAKEAVQFFISKGWSPAQAAGIVGNLQAESGANLKTNAIGDGGKAYGIAQWHPDRQANFRRAYGKDIREAGFKEQLAFVQWELENTERNAAAKLRQTKTPEQAAWSFDEYYERSSGAHRQKRINNALALAPKSSVTV